MADALSNSHLFISALQRRLYYKLHNIQKTETINSQLLAARVDNLVRRLSHTELHRANRAAILLLTRPLRNGEDTVLVLFWLPRSLLLIYSKL